MEANIYTQEGKAKGKISLPEEIFSLPWNADLVHQVFVSMTSNARENVAHTKTRGEVRGGGKKPWRQKGTGRARHGSTRSPIWVGGGVAHGPRNEKNFSRKINKKMKLQALLTVLSKKMKDGEIIFIDSLTFKEPKTKEAKTVIANLASVNGMDKLTKSRKNTAWIGLPKAELNVMKSFRNFGNVEVDEFRNINPVTALSKKVLIFVDPKEMISEMKKKISK